MQEQQFELSVGDVLQIGESVVMVMDVDNGTATFRIDNEKAEAFAFEQVPDAVKDVQQAAGPESAPGAGGSSLPD